MTTIPASSLPSLSASAVSRALGAAGFRVVPLDDARRRGAGISVSRSTLGEVLIQITYTASKTSRVSAEIEALLPELGLRLRSKDGVATGGEATIFLYVQRAARAPEGPAQETAEEEAHAAGAAALVYCTAHNPRGTAPAAHLEGPECREPHYAAPTLAPKSTSPEYRLLERILAAQAGATAPTVEALELVKGALERAYREGTQEVEANPGWYGLD